MVIESGELSPNSARLTACRAGDIVVVGEKGGFKFLYALDWAAPTNFVKPFSDAMLKLGKGKFTDVPVQSQFGWHVIRLDDTRGTQFPPFDQVKQQLVNGLQQQEIQKFLAELRSKAKIETQ